MGLRCGCVTGWEAWKGSVTVNIVNLTVCYKEADKRNHDTVRYRCIWPRHSCFFPCFFNKPWESSLYVTAILSWFKRIKKNTLLCTRYEKVRSGQKHHSKCTVQGSLNHRAHKCDHDSDVKIDFLTNVVLFQTARAEKQPLKWFANAFPQQQKRSSILYCLTGGCSFSQQGSIKTQNNKHKDHETQWDCNKCQKIFASWWSHFCPSLIVKHCHKGETKKPHDCRLLFWLSWLKACEWYTVVLYITHTVDIFLEARGREEGGGGGPWVLLPWQQVSMWNNSCGTECYGVSGPLPSSSLPWPSLCFHPSLSAPVQH